MATDEKNVEVVEKYLELIEDEDNKKAVEVMISDVADRYFTTPASASKDRHNCFVGGLVEHNINVTKNLLDVNKAINAGLSESSLVLVGLFHNLGKIGDLQGNTFYVPTKEAWQHKKGIMFEFNKEGLVDNLSIPQRSIRILNEYGVKLTDEEYFAIVSYEGLYSEANQTNAVMYNKSKLARMLQFADSYITFCISNAKNEE